MQCPLAGGGGAGDLEGGSVSLSLSSSGGWVLSWLKKGMEKVVPQPVPSGGPAQSMAAGSEGPAQVLLGQELRWAAWEAMASGLSVLMCPSVLAGRCTDVWAMQHWGLR